MSHAGGGRHVQAIVGDWRRSTEVAKHSNDSDNTRMRDTAENSDDEKNAVRNIKNKARIERTRKQLRKVSATIGALATSMRAMGVHAGSTRAAATTEVIDMYKALLQCDPSQRTESDVRLIVRMLKGVKFLKALSEKHLLQVCRCVVLRPFRARGLSIVKQGEVGNSFYIILRGAVSVYVKQGGVGPGGVEDTDKGFLVARLNTGDAFGELALTSDEEVVRHATVVTDEPVDCLVLGKSDYRRILQTDHDEHMRIVRKFLDKVPVFRALPPSAMDKLCAVLQRRVIGLGGLIQREGQVHNRLQFLTIIKRGHCEVLRSKHPEVLRAQALRLFRQQQRDNMPQYHSSLRPRKRSTASTEDSGSVPEDSVRLCSVSPTQVLVDPTAMSCFESIGRARKRKNTPDIYNVTICASTRVEVLALSRFDYSRLVWPYAKCHKAVKATMLRAPDAADLKFLVQSSHEWERYKKRLLNDVMLQNKRRKAKPLARGALPTRKSVKEDAARKLPGSPDVDSPERIAFKRRRRRQQRAAHRAKRQAALVDIGLGQAGGGSGPPSVVASVTSRRASQGAQQEAQHTRPGRASIVGRVGGEEVSHGRRRRSQASSTSGATVTVSIRDSSASTQRRNGRRGRPPRRGKGARAGRRRSQPAAGSEYIAFPQWHVSHKGGISYDKEWAARQPKVRSRGSSEGGARSSIRMLGKSSTTPVLPKPTVSTQPHNHGGRRNSVDKKGRRARRQFSRNETAPTLPVPSSKHTVLPAMTKAHFQGYLQEGVAVDNRWGHLRVSPLVEARMMEAMGFEHGTVEPGSDEHLHMMEHFKWGDDVFAAPDVARSGKSRAFRSKIKIMMGNAPSRRKSQAGRAAAKLHHSPVAAAAIRYNLQKAI